MATDRANACEVIHVSSIMKRSNRRILQCARVTIKATNYRLPRTYSRHVTARRDCVISQQHHDSFTTTTPHISDNPSFRRLPEPRSSSATTRSTAHSLTPSIPSMAPDTAHDTAGFRFLDLPAGIVVNKQDKQAVDSLLGLLV
jgi:hypothetical protein